MFFVINLKKNEGRWKKTRRRLLGAGWKTAVRVDAIDGRAVGHEWLHRHGIYHGTLGHRGCSASHVWLWQMHGNASILDDQRPACLSIFEDDVIPHENFKAIVDEYVSETPHDADIIYMVRSCTCIYSKNNY